MAAQGGHGRDTRGEHDAHGYESLYREVESSGIEARISREARVSRISGWGPPCILEHLRSPRKKTPLGG